MKEKLQLHIYLFIYFRENGGCSIDSFTILSGVVLVHELLFTLIPISFEFLDRAIISVRD